MKKIVLILTLFVSTLSFAAKREYIWPKGKMPHPQMTQVSEMLSVTQQDGFKPDKNRVAYLEWLDAPAPEKRNGACAILISGGGYYCCCDEELIKQWADQLTDEGVQCVYFVYRTPRPEGLPFYQSAWEDGQRAVKLVRSEAAKRGFDPEKIGTVSQSAGSHLAILLGTSSQTPAYDRIDAIDDVPGHINWAIVNCPAYITTDADKNGEPATRQGYGPDVKLSPVFKFDEKTCPMTFQHGGNDPYSPNGSTLMYRKLREMGIPAELHLYADKPHGAFGFDRAKEFLRQMGILGPVGPEVELMSRFPDDSARSSYSKEAVWPEGKMPDPQANQCEPYIEWHTPKVLKTKAIQIIYSGGSYIGNETDGFEVAPARRYLNEKGVTVVTMKYRTPRPEGLAKHTTAWEDLQRTIRIVRSQAVERGLDPDRIGIMGSSAGGHLTLMGCTSSRHNSYGRIDEIDDIPCNVQWGVGIYPAYALTDGADDFNTSKGNADDAYLVPEFSFDLSTCPMIFIHGDADPWASMNSVKTWEKMRAMGIQSELHTLALRSHCFQIMASEGTGSYTFLDRIWDFLNAKGFLNDLQK